MWSFWGNFGVYLAQILERNLAFYLVKPLHGYALYVVDVSGGIVTMSLELLRKYVAFMTARSLMSWRRPH